MLVALFAHISGFFMKWGLFFSHLKFHAAVMTGNIHHVAGHYVYSTVYKVARPFMMWNPV